MQGISDWGGGSCQPVTGDPRQGDERGRDQALKLPVVGAMGLVGLREGRRVVDGPRVDGCRRG